MHIICTPQNRLIQIDKMSYCTLFIKANDSPPNLQEIKTRISSGSLQEKVSGVKQLIKCIINDETFPPIIMHIITNIIPTQHKSQQLRKVMLLYWEIIEKTKSATDKSLKEQIFLACNSLRNDLIGHNEYVRGRTLRLLSRIMHKGVIEPLASAISKNLQHKSAYVRRNAVICIYNIHNAFGSDIIGEIDDEIQELLKVQTDLSTKRNAFILLNKSNPKKAMQYLDTQITNQSVQEIGDILQLAILQILKQKCKEDPTQKPRLLKIVNDFLQKATESVRLECAITSTAISNSAFTIKNSLTSYVSILAKSNEMNVKKIILDKLSVICKNSNYLQEDLIEDLIKGLNTPSVEIKIKILEIVMTCITSKSSELVLKYLQKQNLIGATGDYIEKMLSLLQLITFKFGSTHKEMTGLFSNKLLKLHEFTHESIVAITNIISLILKSKDVELAKSFTQKLISSLGFIQSPDFFKIILNILGTRLENQSEIILAINQFKILIGTLPIAPSNKPKIQHQQQNLTQANQDKKIFKTVILEDGSYSSELVSVKKEEKSFKEIELENTEHFRNFLIGDSIFGGVFARNVARLLYKIRKSKHFNKYGTSILMILCSLLRHYQQNLQFVDQAIIDQITVIIRKIVNPTTFISTEDSLLEHQAEHFHENYTFNEKNVEMIEKNPEDLINFRLLKKSGEDNLEFGFDDEEVNDITEQTIERVDYVSKLKSIVQLTGTFDPLYSEAFIRVNKYDLFFEILLINNTKHNLSNVQVQFASNVETLILEKAQSVNLRPFQSVFLRSQLRFISSEFGVIYGYINYDNQAGLEQPYLITEQIKIDYLQFIQPASISDSDFKLLWQKAEHQIVFELTILPTLNKTFKKIITEYEKVLHAKLVQQIDEHEKQYFLNCHLFGKSKLGENFFINVALFSGETISLTATIRSKDKAVRDIIHKEIQKHKFVQEEDLLEEP